MPGFVSVTRYGSLVPIVGEIGSAGGVLYIESAVETTEFVTSIEFAKWMRHPNFRRESPIQGRIFNTIFISLVPPEATCA